MNDGSADSDPVSLSIDYTDGNLPPAHRSSFGDEYVSIGSTDKDGCQVYYHWSITRQPSGSTATLSDASQVRPTFTPDLAGTYRERLTIDKAITLRGSVMTQTIIDAGNVGNSDGCQPAVSIQSDNVSISGFTIKGGFPGVDIEGDHVSISNCLIIDNTSSDDCGSQINPDNFGNHGMGVAVYGDDCTLKNNVIANNSDAYGFGGSGCGVYATGVDALTIVRHEGAERRPLWSPDTVPCCTGDEGRPLGAAMQVEASNHLKLLWSKAMVVSVKEKVPHDGIR